MRDIEKSRRRGAVWYLLLASLSYFVLTAMTASRRPLWYDELFTFHIARLGSIREVISALLGGADIHPPLDYLLRHVSMRAFGISELADRLPSILAFWVACVATCRIVSFRCGRLIGLAAFVAPVVTLAYDYAYDGRPYAPMLGASMLALAAWQSAAAGVQRRLTLPVMGAMLALAVNVHYYGCFVYLPIVAGESCRAWIRRRIDWPLVLTAAASALALVIDLPFLAAQSGKMGTFWTSATPGQTAIAYWHLLNPAVIVVPIFAGLLMLWPAMREPDGLRPADEPVPTHERAAALAMLLIPVVCFTLGKTASFPFLYRYMLLTVFGAILAACFAGREFFSRPRVGATLLVAVSVTAAYRMAITARETMTAESGFERQRRVEGLLPRDQTPIVYGSRSEFMKAARYGSSENLAIAHYLVDRKASQQRLGNDNGQWSMRNIAPFLPGHVTDYATFLCDTDRFLLVNPRTGSDWLLPQLLEDRARVTYRKLSHNDEIFEVVPDRPCVPPGDERR